jgi:hypothetical protein
MQRGRVPRRSGEETVHAIEIYDFICPFDLLPFIGLNHFVRRVPGWILARPTHVASPLCSMSLATSPVHPVWWLAPIPAPLSPWKYSWK